MTVRKRDDAKGWQRGNGAYSSDKSGLTKKYLYTVKAGREPGNDILRIAQENSREEGGNGPLTKR